jgi:hypothetical protein
MARKLLSPHTDSTLFTYLVGSKSFIRSNSSAVDIKRKATAMSLLLLMILSFVTQISNAQSSGYKNKKVRPIATPAIEVTSFEAAGNAQGALLKWKTDSEINHLGFNLYRDEAGQRVLMNQQLVTNNILTISFDAAPASGHSYEWLDNSPAKDVATYWLEALDLNGNSTWQGPFTVQFTRDHSSATEGEQALALISQEQRVQGSSPVESRATLSHSDLLASKIQPSPAPATSLKLSVPHEGWYTISQAELLGAGLSTAVDPRYLQVYADSQPQAIFVRGQEDGKLDPADTLEFYGQGIDSPYSTSRTYWLVEGKTAGLRLASAPSVAPATDGGNFPFTVERRDKTIYFSSLLNGNQENFFGAIISRVPLNQTLTLKNLDSSATQEATLQVSLQGVTWYDHTVEVKINGNALGQLDYFGQISGEATYSFPHTFLNEGENRVTLTPLGGNNDTSLVDSLRLTYQHTYIAENDFLRLSTKAQQRFTVWGFSNDSIEVFDVTNAAAVRKLRGNPVTRKSKQDGSVEYGVSLVVHGSGVKELLALAQNRFGRVTKIALDSPSELKNPSQGADFVIITKKEFFPAAETLQALRKNQGLSAVIVDIEDIYDEFSFGQKTPQAVKDFLHYAMNNWQRPVRYALFFGDASFDPKNYLGRGDFDFVPTKLVDTLFLETATDDWFADFDENGISDIAVGRLPAANLAEANLMTAKLVAYEKAAPSNDVLMVSDFNDVHNFEGENESLVPMLPSNSNVTFVKRSHMSDTQARAAIIENFNRGPKIVNYAGHGSVNLWRGNLFTNSDAMNLQNMAGLPMVITMNCLNGYFHDPVLQGLSETLLKAPQGGAVAAWGSSAQTFADAQVPVNQEFYRLVFMNPSEGVTIGEAAIRAKTMTDDLDVRYSWILFGDPTMRLK